MALGIAGAARISTVTKTRPYWEGDSPRWLLRFLPWVDLDAGMYRVNTVTAEVEVSAEHAPGQDLPSTFADFSEQASDHHLSVIQTILTIHKRVGDIYNDPWDQVAEQRRITIQRMREEEEDRLVNSAEFGLVHSVDGSMSVPTLTGPPTPDDLDGLIALVWKKPAFFLAHPLAIAAFGRECTQRGVCVGTVELFGSPFLTWRGVPIVPSDKLAVSDQGETRILLMRVGEDERGVVGLRQTGIPNEFEPSLSIVLNGVDQKGRYNYLLSLYTSLAVIVPDALAMLHSVKVHP